MTKPECGGLTGPLTPTMARPCAAIQKRELADEVTPTPISTHMAAGTSRRSTAPAADLRDVMAFVFCASSGFLIGWAMAWVM